MPTRQEGKNSGRLSSGKRRSGPTPSRPRPAYSASYSRPWHIDIRRWLQTRLQPVKSFVRSLLVLSAKLVVAGLILSFPALTAYHWSEGASLGDAAKLTTWDIRFIAECYDKPATIPRFIAQNNLTGTFPRLVLLLNGGTVDEYLTRSCNELRNTPRE